MQAQNLDSVEEDEIQVQVGSEPCVIQSVSGRV